MSNWNDDRLDKRDQEVREGLARVEGQVKSLEGRMNEGFARVEGQVVRVEGQVKSLEGRMDEGFAEMRSAFAALTRTLLVGAIAIVAALIGVIGALLA